MTWTVTWLTCNLRRRGVKARAGLVERLQEMQMLAQVDKQLQAQQDVFVAVRLQVDLAVVVMTMVPPPPTAWFAFLTSPARIVFCCTSVPPPPAPLRRHQQPRSR